MIRTTRSAPFVRSPRISLVAVSIGLNEQLTEKQRVESRCEQNDKRVMISSGKVATKSGSRFRTAVGGGLPDPGRLPRLVPPYMRVVRVVVVVTERG